MPGPVCRFWPFLAGFRDDAARPDLLPRAAAGDAESRRAESPFAITSAARRSVTGPHAPGSGKHSSIQYLGLHLRCPRVLDHTRRIRTH